MAQRRVHFTEPMEDENDSEEQPVPSTQAIMDASQVELSPVTAHQRDNTTSLHHQEADVGVIEEITLVDFMCHKRLSVQLSPNVTFILGQNGSGKSAIMTAIVVALGGKATSTHRGSSLKKFIRTSCRQAEIILRLRNRGEDAYKPDEYGTAITVVRQINAEGAGSYKLKNTKGRIISTHKEDLTRILEWFNIQIDNPVSMLNQDTSRNFLHSSNPSAKFKLFMKGTHLEQIAHDYAHTEEQQQLLKREIERKRELLPDLELAAKRWEEEVRSIDQLLRAEEKVKKLNQELMWAIVAKLRTSVSSLQKLVDGLREKVARNEERLKGGEKKLEEKRVALQSVRSELEEVVRETREAEQKQSELLNEKRAKEKSVREAKSKVAATRRDIGKVERDKGEYTKHLEELREQSMRDVAGEKEAVRVKLEGKQEQLQSCEQKLAAAEADKRSKSDELQAMTRDYKQHCMRTADLRQSLSDCDDIIGRLQGNRGHALQGYPRWMVDLVNILQQNSRQFRKPPKGPLGAAVKLREQKWSTAVEAVIGGNLLHSFVVDNRQDEFAFNRIVRQWMSRGGGGRKAPSCICSSFEGRVHDTSRFRPHCNYPTVLDQVIVADPDIMNTLIEMNNIDTILLIADKVEARQVMWDNNPPANAQSVYTIEGDLVLPNGRYYSNKNRPQGIIRASIQETIDMERRKRDGFAQQLREAEERENGMRRQQAEVKSMSERIAKYIRDAQNDRHRLNMALEKLKGQLEDLNQNAEEDIITWEAEVHECEDKLQDLKTKKQSEEEQVKKAEELLAAHNQTIEEYKRSVENVNNRVEEIKEKMKNAAKEKDHVQRFVQLCIDKKNSHASKLTEEETQLQDLEKQLTDASTNAEQQCDEIRTSRTPENIKSEITKLESHLRSQQDKRQNQLEIRQNYVAAVEKYELTVEEIRTEERTRKELGSSLEQRKLNYHELQQRIAQRCVLYFNNYIRRRGYDGALNFDLQNKKLEIIVKVGGASQVTKNTRSLSGGERSFATVSFIMALWEAIESPFRCLDEFDVFMDLMNRKISMELMMESAAQQTNRQFIFFTPQDMSSLGIKGPKNSKVLRLLPPDRNQSTLDEVMQ